MKFPALIVLWSIALLCLGNVFTLLATGPIVMAIPFVLFTGAGFLVLGLTARERVRALGYAAGVWMTYFLVVGVFWGNSFQVGLGAAYAVITGAAFWFTRNKKRSEGREESHA